MKRIILVCSIAVAIASFSGSLWMYSKSILGQVLLEDAWQETVATGRPSKPWPWADTWPVAKLSVPSTKHALVVLEGTSGEAMAFGPGRITGSSNSAANGTYAIGGHRDSHLAFLQYITNNDVIELQTNDGISTRYEVTEQFVADSTENSLMIDPSAHALVLVTCYPFEAMQTGGPLRYVVVATKQPYTDQPTTKQPYI